jgi:tetratricopeptide (TPR) repeat protein
MARLRWLPLCLMLTAGAPAGDAYSALMARAQAEFDVGHGTEAMALFGEAAKSAPDAHGEMIALYDVGVTANAMGQPQLAVAPLARALQMARQTGDAGLEEAALAKLADASFDAGDLPHTISAYGDLLARAEAAGNEATAAVAAERLGSAQLRSGEARAALPHLRRAAALYVKSGERVPQARVLLSLGTAADQADQYLEAADAFSRSAAISHELNDKADESRALNGQAVAVYHLGDFAASVTLGRKAVALASRALDRVAEDEARTSLGNAQGLQGNWQEAVKSYQQVLDDAHASGDQAREGEAAGNLGLAYMHLEDYGRAEGLLRQDIGIAHKRGATLVEAQALDDLGSMLAQRGRDADAIPVLEHSRDLASSVGASRSEALALRALGPAQMRTGRLAEAEGTLRRAVAIREALRAQASRDDRYNISLLDTGTEDYLRLQAVLVAENRPEAALEASDAARARALADKLALLAGEKLPAHQLTAGEIGAVAAETGVTLVEFSVLDEANRILIWVIRPDGSIVFRPLSVKGGSIGDIMDPRYPNDAWCRAGSGAGVGRRPGPPRPEAGSALPPADRADCRSVAGLTCRHRRAYPRGQAVRTALRSPARRFGPQFHRGARAGDGTLGAGFRATGAQARPACNRRLRGGRPRLRAYTFGATRGGADAAGHSANRARSESGGGAAAHACPAGGGGHQGGGACCDAGRRHDPPRHPRVCAGRAWRRISRRACSGAGSRR